mgnify:CR=1 FL=1
MLSPLSTVGAGIGVLDHSAIVAVVLGAVGWTGRMVAAVVARHRRDRAAELDLGPAILGRVDKLGVVGRAELGDAGDRVGRVGLVAVLRHPDREARTLPVGAHGTVERARQYARRAIDALAIFPSSKAKAAMIEAAEFAVARAY